MANDLDVKQTGEGTVATFNNKILDDANVQGIGEELFKLVDHISAGKLILNFSNVEYLSSAALGKLISLNKKVNAVGSKLLLCDMPPQIFEIFQVTRLDKLFTFGDKSA
jgi:anti-sigma B factor antagonist